MTLVVADVMNHFGWESKALTDGKDVRAPGSNQMGTFFGTSVLNGWGLVGVRVNISAPVG